MKRITAGIQYRSLPASLSSNRHRVAAEETRADRVVTRCNGHKRRRDSDSENSLLLKNLWFEIRRFFYLENLIFQHIVHKGHIDFT